MKLKTLIGLCLIITSQISMALDIKREQAVPADELLKRTKTVVLARAVKAEIADDKGGVTYTFATIQKHKGDPGKTFTITGGTLMSGDDLLTFDHHHSDGFWRQYGGRSYPDTDEEIHPTFSVGCAYLIFLEKPYHLKSFEHIVRTNGGPDVRDKWLQWVESQTKAELDTDSNDDQAH